MLKPSWSWSAAHVCWNRSAAARGRCYWRMRFADIVKWHGGSRVTQGNCGKTKIATWKQGSSQRVHSQVSASRQFGGFLEKIRQVGGTSSGCRESHRRPKKRCASQQAVLHSGLGVRDALAQTFRIRKLKLIPYHRRYHSPRKSNSNEPPFRVCRLACRLLLLSPGTVVRSIRLLQFV